MIISLRCKECRETLSGGKDEYLFICPNCGTLYLFREDRFDKTEAFITSGDSEFNILLTFLLFRSEVEYLDFSTNRQKEISIRCGINPIIAVRAFSMIDPIYFGDMEIEITAKINKSQTEIIPYSPHKKNFMMDIKPQILERLARYTFMKYFDIQTDITGMKYSFKIESSAVLFLRGKVSGNKIIIPDINKEIPKSAILAI
ncbi:MAG: hypothetical protein N3B13_05880 [Deltaproteobacteria bacterium]|nr:hypothetical protein [Deltaproteobacteria bacterium]